ncbi:hypothetical protein BaRGS_00031045 [Batillaria attramentaria]|uniref:Arrestin C-terminal-like domain-containing protein n=1 Tax=Batillaria attramentaria TaxID=370345 RepID=A0ABD0JSD0_9CAEN
MGKITTFEIFVNNSEGGSVKAGETFSGEVFLELSGDIDVNGEENAAWNLSCHGLNGKSLVFSAVVNAPPCTKVRVTFTGRSHVQWAEAQKTAPMAEIQTSVVDPVVGEELYVSDQIKLFPPYTRSHCESVVLKKGSHSFSFEFTVPETAPSSFSGSHGYVRYVLKATVERPWKVEVNTRILTVLSELDLNLKPAAKESVELSDSMKITTFPLFSDGECRATMRLSRKGFLPGETIPVELAIHNDSHHELHKASLQLKMTIKYKVTGKVCTNELVLAKSRLGRVPAGRTFEGFDRKLRVPKTCPPTGLPGCHLISIKYNVELRIKPSLLSLKRLKLNTNIIIGTKPLDMSFNDSPPDYYTCCR